MNARRPFGFWTLVCLVVANMIGAGIFTTSGFTIENLGSPRWVMAAWIIAGMIAICGAFSYGGLVHIIPQAGGEYLFLSRTFGPLWGFLAGWVSLIAGFTGAIAIAAVAFESYAVPDEVRPAWLPPNALACAAILVAGMAHGLRVRAGATMQNSVVAVKLLMIAIFLFVALMQWNQDTWRGAATAVDLTHQPRFVLALATSIMWISLSYSGFNAAVYVVEEVNAAARFVPRALIVGTLFVFGLYLALNVVFVYSPANEAIAGKRDVAAIAARALGGDPLADLVRAVIVIAQFTSITSMIMAAPRVYAKMASDGLLPRWLSLESEAPRKAIFAQVALAIGFVLVSTLQGLMKYLSVTLALSAAATATCLFVRRQELRPNWRWVLLPTAIYVVCTTGLAVMMACDEPRNLLGTAITVGSGTCLYFWLKPKTATAMADERPKTVAP
jgi:APA family basic amino acid/polyamine antiporter